MCFNLDISKLSSEKLHLSAFRITHELGFNSISFSMFSLAMFDRFYYFIKNSGDYHMINTFDKGVWYLFRITSSVSHSPYHTPLTSQKFCDCNSHCYGHIASLQYPIVAKQCPIVKIQQSLKLLKKNQSL